MLIGADSLRPSALTVPLRGKKLSVGTFFSVINNDGLQRTVDTLAYSGFTPTIETYKGFEGAVNALENLKQHHPRGKVVITLRY